MKSSQSFLLVVVFAFLSTTLFAQNSESIAKHISARVPILGSSSHEMAAVRPSSTSNRVQQPPVLTPANP